MEMLNEMLHTGIEFLTFGGIVWAVWRFRGYQKDVTSELKAADKSRGLIHKDIEEMKPMKEDIAGIKMYLKMQPNGMPD